MAQGQVQENELKFKLADLPVDLVEGTLINQRYLDFKNDPELQSKANELFAQNLDWNKFKELRIRRRGEQYYLTAKGGGAASRAEIEVELIDPAVIEDLETNYPILGEVNKVRYLKQLSNGLTAEIDQYLDKLDGLIVAEVEFTLGENATSDEIDAVKKRIEDEMKVIALNAENVTEIQAYKNKELALAKSFQEVIHKAEEEQHLREMGLKKA